eukprot:jgi/Ulvmu1/46/UM001_0049.1
MRQGQRGGEEGLRETCRGPAGAHLHVLLASTCRLPPPPPPPPSSPSGLSSSLREVLSPAVADVIQLCIMGGVLITQPQPLVLAGAAALSWPWR